MTFNTVTIYLDHCSKEMDILGMFETKCWNKRHTEESSHVVYGGSNPCSCRPSRGAGEFHGT